MAILKPMPSGPSRLATGTRQSSKITWRVGWAFQPIFFSFGAEGEAGRVLLDHERRDAARAVLAGAHHGDVDVRGAGARDELLDAVEHVVVAVAPRACLQRRRVGARARLGQAIAGDMLHAGELRQEALALLVASRRRRSSTTPCCGSR